MKSLLLASLSLVAMSPSGAAPPRTIPASIASQGRVVLPLVLRHGFPFVAGTVNDRQGYFMLDTGSPFAVFMNGDYLRLPKGAEIARGAAGSGQKIVVSQHGCMKSVVIASAYTIDTLCGLRAGDLGFVAKELEPRFLGFIGYELFKDYRLSLDFRRREAIISDAAEPVEQGAVASLRFAPEDKNVPKVTLTVGTVILAGHMDTGDEGHIELTRADADAHIASGKLEEVLAKDGSKRLVVPRVEHDGILLRSADLPVTIAAKRGIVLGFRFLKDFRSVWNFSDHTVRLYPASARPASKKEGSRRG